MNNLEWHPVFYNGLETNVEVTKCGRVRRVKVNWIKNKSKLGEFDFNKKKYKSGYQSIGVQIKELRFFSNQIKESKLRTLQVHQLVASVFLGYKWNGHTFVVDHIDSDKLNNNVDNLQILTHIQNTLKEKSFKSLKKQNIYFNNMVKSYICQIKINNDYKYIGMFKDKNDALNHYNNKLKEISITKNN
jgi:hypothetical protein